MIKEIHASVKCTPKINNTFYSFEYGEVQAVKEGITQKELKKQREELWDTCINEVMHQANETIKESRNSQK